MRGPLPWRPVREELFLLNIDPMVKRPKFRRIQLNRFSHCCAEIYTFRHSVKPRFAWCEAACFQRGRERVEPRILVQPDNPEHNFRVDRHSGAPETRRNICDGHSRPPQTQAASF